MKYTELQARLDIAQAIGQEWAASPYASVPVKGPNLAAPDLDRHDLVLDFDILMQDQKQVSIEGDMSALRTTGKIELNVGCREGSGYLKAVEIRVFLTEVCRARWWGNVRIMVPRLRPTFSVSGWTFYPIDVPFHYDDRRLNGT